MTRPFQLVACAAPLLTACHSHQPPDQAASSLHIETKPAASGSTTTVAPTTSPPSAGQTEAKAASERSRTAPPPITPAVGKPASPEDLAALDRWADAAGLRASPLRWSVMAIRGAPDVATSADAVYEPKEGPTRATVTIVEDGYLDDSVRGRRYVLEFVRAGAGEWTAEGLAVTQRCWPGRGHEEFSADPCG